MSHKNREPLRTGRSMSPEASSLFLSQNLVEYQRELLAGVLNREGAIGRIKASEMRAALKVVLGDRPRGQVDKQASAGRPISRPTVEPAAHESHDDRHEDERAAA